MYQLKKYAKGAERWIAKLLQNSLYGLFGRNKETLHSIIINVDELPNYVVNSIIKTIIHISDDKLTLLVLGNVESDILSELNTVFSTNITQFHKVVKSNIAIASAITSYARIHMLKYKLSDSVYYTDTDSIFTSEPLNPSEIGPELGEMKDELDGCTISKAYFLGIKQYGYQYQDKHGKLIEKSVWAGVKRNSISFEEIESLFKGNIITRTISNRFFKSLVNLNIAIKDTKVTIEFNPSKKLVGNNYQPLTIHTLAKPNLMKKYVNMFSKFMSKLSNNIQELCWKTYCNLHFYVYYNISQY